ncbi:MAG: hypothetical protein ACP5E5_01040 [Acidobacteriaceae bacterium]
MTIRYRTNVRQRGGDLRIAAPSSFVSSLLDLTMLSTVIRVFPSEQEAVASFVSGHGTRQAEEHSGRRVLAVDPSPHLCAFVRTVLTQHHFAVRTCSILQNAKIVLRSNPTEILLIGPGSAHLSSDAIAQSLAAVAPQATILRLPPQFKTQNAQEATSIFLQFFELPQRPPA